jgi:hypothetical protein
LLERWLRDGLGTLAGAARIAMRSAELHFQEERRDATG